MVYAKSALTREKIRAAANRLFLEQGFDATTVDGIVAAAGVSKGTFYSHFKRKEDLLLEYGWRRLEHLQALVPLSIGQHDFSTALSTLVNQLLHNKTWSREVVLQTIGEINRNPGLLEQQPHKLLQPLLEVASARGQIRTDIPVETLSRYVIRTVLGALQDWAELDNEESAEAAMQQAMLLILSALAPD